MHQILTSWMLWETPLKSPSCVASVRTGCPPRRAGTVYLDGPGTFGEGPDFNRVDAGMNPVAGIALPVDASLPALAASRRRLCSILKLVRRVGRIDRRESLPVVEEETDAKVSRSAFIRGK